MNSDTIAIIGGGVAGLVCAIELENNGHQCIIFEKDAEVGGRLKTIIKDGIALDFGFQVLLTAYPEAKKYLDYEDLDLLFFEPGAMLFKAGKQSYFGDPQRDLKALPSTLSSWAGSYNDKLRVFSLSKLLKRKTISEIFASDEVTTLEYLQNYGFSSAILENFFIPFFSGIFLENKLDTSSRMFEFVFKMFAEGSAAIPRNGIQAIPRQLAKQLANTKIMANTMVKLQDGTISAPGVDAFKPKAIVKAFNSNTELSSWKSCTTFYFQSKKNTLSKKCIGLLIDNKSIINSFYFLNSLNKEINQSIISVTCVGQTQNIEILEEKVVMELKEKLGITVLKKIECADVPMSLPLVGDISDATKTEVFLSSEVPIVEAGDHASYASLNGAMLSGGKAAKALIEHWNHI